MFFEIFVLGEEQRDISFFDLFFHVFWFSDHIWPAPLLKPFFAQTCALKTLANGAALRDNLLLMSCFFGPWTSRVRPKFGCSPDSPPLNPSPDSTRSAGPRSAGPPSAGPPKMGLHTTAPELQTCTFEGPGFQSHHQFHETTPKRGRKNENSGGRVKKKREILGPPLPFGTPAFGNTSLRGPSAGPDSSHCFWVVCVLFLLLFFGRRPSTPLLSHLCSV